MALSTVRKKMHTLMVETIEDEARRHDWIYRAVRPMRVPSSWRAGQTVTGDCSKGCQYISKWAHGPDPMGRDYDAYGNSTTMTAHLPYADHAYDLDVGDYITFGTYGQDHATVVMEPGSDPLLWSFGHQGAPASYRLSHDGRPKHFRLNPAAVHPPSPADKLRKMKGFWAWFQWKLGEGHWKGHGKANPRVRPDVPRIIPLAWWKHYARIMVLRRKKRGNQELVSTPAG